MWPVILSNTWRVSFLNSAILKIVLREQGVPLWTQEYCQLRSHGQSNCKLHIITSLEQTYMTWLLIVSARKTVSIAVTSRITLPRKWSLFMSESFRCGAITISSKGNHTLLIKIKWTDKHSQGSWTRLEICWSFCGGLAERRLSVVDSRTPPHRWAPPKPLPPPRTAEHSQSQGKQNFT